MTDQKPACTLACVLACLSASALSCAGDREHSEQREPRDTVAATISETQTRSETLTAPNAPPELTAGKPAPTVDSPWMRGKNIQSNGKSYLLVIQPSPNPMPRGENFAIDVWVFAALDREHPLSDVRLSVDAWMPDHGHGMNRTPRIESRADGSFRASDVLLHMPGHWELYFDVTRGAVSERAELEVELD